jgi:hypothetical protein
MISAEALLGLLSMGSSAVIRAYAPGQDHGVAVLIENKQSDLSSSPSNLAERREHGGEARTEFSEFEAHSGSMQRYIGKLWAAFPPAP